jgi:citrate synthase
VNMFTGMFALGRLLGGSAGTTFLLKNGGRPERPYEHFESIENTEVQRRRCPRGG